MTKSYHGELVASIRNKTLQVLSNGKHISHNISECAVWQLIAVNLIARIRRPKRRIYVYGLLSVTPTTPPQAAAISRDTVPAS